MPKQNQLQNQLKSLFDDLEQESSLPQPSHRPVAPGWRWACDADGRYTECSPEVLGVLGIAADTFLGQPVTRFALAPDFSPLVEAAFKAKNFPVELKVHYLDHNQEAVSISLCILSGPDKDGDGWNGMAQTILPGEVEPRKEAPRPEKVEPALTPTPSGGLPHVEEPESPPLPLRPQPFERPSTPLSHRTTPSTYPTIPTSQALSLAGQESLERMEPVVNATTMAIPFRLPENTLGLVEILGEDENRVWNDDEQLLVSQVVDQLSLALENARLFQETQAALNETETLYAITSASNRSLELENTLQEMLERILSAIGMETGLVSMVDPATENLRMVVHQNIPQPMLKGASQENGLANMLCGVVFRQKSALSIEDLQGHTEFDVSAPLKLGFRSYLGVPLETKGRVLGTLCALGKHPYPDSSGSLSLMQVAGQQIGIAIENANLFRETQSRAEELATLNDMSRALSAQLRVEDVLESTHQYTQRLMEVDNFYIALYSPEDNQISFPLAFEEGQRIEMPTRQMGRGLTEHIIYTRQPLLIKENAAEVIQNVLGRELILVGKTPECWLGVPLLLGSQAIGVIAAQDFERPRAFNERHRDLMMAIASQAVIAIQNSRLYQEEQHRRQIADTLREIARVVGSTLDLKEVIERVLDRLPNLFQFTTASIYLVANGKRRLIGRRSVDIEYQGQALGEEWVSFANDPLLNEVIHSHQPAIISDTSTDPRWQERGKAANLLSWVAAPLSAGQEVVGILTLEHTQPSVYTHEVAELATAVAAQAAVAVQNAKLFEENQAALTKTESLYNASADLSTALTYDDILNVLRHHTIAGSNSNLIGITFFDHPWLETNPPEWIDVIARWTNLSTPIPNRYPFQSFPSITALRQVVQHSESALIIENFETDPRMEDVVRELYRVRFMAKSALIVPMIVGGQWIGFVNITYPEIISFQDEDVRRLVALTAQAAVAVQNLRSIDLAEERAREAQERSEELGLINQVVSSLVTSSDLRQSLDAVASILLEKFSLGSVDIALLNETRTILTVVAQKIIGNMLPEVGTTLPVKGNQAIEQVLETHSSLVIADAQNDPLLLAIRDVIDRRHIDCIGIFPIITGGEVIGTIELDITEKGRVFSTQEQSLLTTLVGQISTAIENSRLYEQTQKALAETELLYKASAGLNTARTYDEILNIIINTTMLNHANTTHVLLGLFDRPWVGDNKPEWLKPIASWTTDTNRQFNPLAIGTWTTADLFFHSDTPTYIESAQTDSRLDSEAHQLFVENLKAQSLVFIPLNVAGQWFGHLAAVFGKHTPIHEQDIRPLMTLAGQAAVAIQNIRLLEESRRRTTQLETAAEIARDTSGTLALDILLRRAVNLIRERYGYYHASIFLLDESGLNAMVRESTGEAGEEMKRRSHKLAVGSQSVIGYVTQSGAPLILNNVLTSPTYRPNPLLPETKAEVGIPLKIGYRVIGALDVQSNHLDAFGTDDVSVLQTLADQIAVAVDNARSYEMAQLAIAESRKRVQELSVLYNVTQSLSSAPLESGEIANIVARQYMDILDVPRCSLSGFSVGSNDLKMIADLARPRGGAGATADAYVSEDIGIIINTEEHPAVVRVMHTLQPLIIQANDPFGDQMELAYMKANGVETLAILPLAVKGQAIGIVMLESWGRPRTYSPDQINLAMTLGNAAAVALDNARLYEEQREATEKLREVDKLKSQFLANMSHELRTPLNSIIGFSRVILKGIDGEVTELQRQDLTAINSAGQHLLNLINDILDISKIEAGKMELAFEDNVNLNDMLNSAMSYAIGLTKDKPITLIKSYAPNLPSIRADATKMRQVIINFLSNATKFTEQGSITLSAVMQTDADGHPEVKLSVTDTGAGISEEDQKRLFQPFTQVDGSLTRKVGGTGLGLSISKRLVEMHGGRVELESEVDKGSTFSVILPLPYIEPANTGAGENKVILAIDDDRQVISLYERYLTGQGYQVVALTEPAQAVEEAKKVAPFAITLDIMMPNRNGWQVLEALKADQYTRDIPVVICSIVEDHEKGFSLGAADYLTKPILQDDLVSALGRLNGDGSIRDVLVIDDDPDDLRLVEKILRENNQYDVRLANGGPEGLIAIHEKPPQAIILDLMMPELDGFTLLETIRSEPHLRDIPVIIFTAGDLTEEQQLHLAESSQEMIYKNAFKEEDLLKSIEKALERFKVHK